MRIPWYIKLLLVLLMMATMVLCFAVGAVVGYDIGKAEVYREAVDRGHADYDLETGGWKWNSSQ